MRRPVGSLSISSLMIFATGLATIQAQMPMEDYNNARFGYHVSFPRSLLEPLPEADNGDGLHFKPLQGHADVEVYAGWLEPDIDSRCAGKHSPEPRNVLPGRLLMTSKDATSK